MQGRQVLGAGLPAPRSQGGYWCIFHPISCHTDTGLPAQRSLITEHPPLPREEPIAVRCRDEALAAAAVWLAGATCLFCDTAA